MCGRYVLFSPAEHLTGLLGLDVCCDLAPRYNIAPSQPIPVIRRDEHGVTTLSPVTWGLVPSWVKDPADWPKPINARSESVATKPAYREAIRSRRCLVPADGFYEWKTLEDAVGSGSSRPLKQPMLIRTTDDEPFLMAGVWETWPAPDGSRLETCAILTTTPNDLLRPIHDRMPVIVDRADQNRWLDPATQDPEQVRDLMSPLPPERFRMHPVSTRVNSPKHDGPELVAPVEEARPNPGLFG